MYVFEYQQEGPAKSFTFDDLPGYRKYFLPDLRRLKVLDMFSIFVGYRETTGL